MSLYYIYILYFIIYVIYINIYFIYIYILYYIYYILHFIYIVYITAWYQGLKLRFHWNISCSILIEADVLVYTIYVSYIIALKTKIDQLNAVVLLGNIAGNIFCECGMEMTLWLLLGAVQWLRHAKIAIFWPSHPLPSRFITNDHSTHLTLRRAWHRYSLYHLFLFFEAEKKSQRYAPTHDTSTHFVIYYLFLFILCFKIGWIPVALQVLQSNLNQLTKFTKGKCNKGS